MYIYRKPTQEGLDRGRRYYICRPLRLSPLAAKGLVGGSLQAYYYTRSLQEQARTLNHPAGSPGRENPNHIGLPSSPFTMANPNIATEQLLELLLTLKVSPP